MSYMFYGILGIAACAGTSPGSRGADRQRTGGRGGAAPVLADGATEAATGDLQGIRRQAVEVRLSSAPTPGYGGAVDHALSRGEAALVAGLVAAGERKNKSNTQNKKLKITHDPRLSRLARELARVAPDRHHMPHALLDGLMAWTGLVDPPPRLAVVEVTGPCADEPAAAECAEAIATLTADARGEEVGEGARLGVGIAELPGGLSRIIVARSEHLVDLKPIPLEVAAGATIAVDGRLLGGRKDPRVEVVLPTASGEPGGEWRRIAHRGDARRFTAAVPCEGDGGHRIEVLAEGPQGPEVAANFTVYCGVQAPRTVAFLIEAVDPGSTVATIERANFNALNDDRRRRGLAPLRWSNAAAAAARAHSEEMAAGDFIGHRSPITGSASDRLERAGVAALTVRENVGRGYGPVTIHDALMNSPGHRINILAPDVTEVGVGAAIGAPESTAADAPRPIFLTQKFFRVAEAPPRDPVAALRQGVDRAREAAGQPALPWDPGLAAIAQRYAEGIASGGVEGAQRRLRADFEASPHAAIETHQVTASEFRALVEIDLWGQALPATAVGVGVAENTAGERAGMLTLIVLVAGGS